MKALIGAALVASVLGAVLFLHGAGGSSTASPFSVSAAMAAAKCPDITDTNTHPLPYGQLPTASLDPRTCAIDFGIPAGKPGDPGAAGAVGPKGPTGQDGCCKEETTNLNSSRSNNLRMAGTANCPGGTTVTGGGAWATTVHGSKSRFNVSFIWVVTNSGPTKNHGWRAEATNLNSSRSNTYKTAAPPPPGTLTVTAICKKK